MGYTKKEVQEKIDFLTNKIYDDKISRTELSQRINNMEKQLQNWLEVNLNQGKLF